MTNDTVTNALAAALERQAETPAKAAPKMRQRNYKAMGDAKLIKVAAELRDGGDAAQPHRTDDPERDKAIVAELLAERGLVIA